MTPKKFSTAILKWFDKYGRKNLPWQKTNSPYHVWISEIMLQQTQVKTVIPYFERFVRRFPTPAKLANASEDEILSLWTGLGYYNRARNLQKTAKLLIAKYNGCFPHDADALQKLPGIGRSTAGAIMSIALGQRAPILDGNVKRVLTRVYVITGWPGQPEVQKKLWKIAENNTPYTRVAEYTQAIMDIGALICTRTQPKCNSCPLSTSCIAHSHGHETIYPTTKPRKQVPTQQINMLLLTNPRNEVLLEKRPPTGIWASLWAFPEYPADLAEDALDIQSWCKQRYHCQINAVIPMAPIRHVLTHRILDIHPYRVDVSKPALRLSEPHTQRWYTVDDPQAIGLAAPVVQLLSRSAPQKENA